MKRKLPILSIVQAGNPEFERWAISDQQFRQWNGDRFDYGSGQLYSNYNTASFDTQQILRNYFAGIQPVLYEAPVLVEVFSHEPIHQATVALHLSEAARLYMNTPEHGHGPDGSLVLPCIDWSEMREK